jgi:hypothetical protein
LLESGKANCGGAMARRSSLWTDIARDRERRRRQNERAARVQRQVAKELEADSARARHADEREAKPREKERIEAERLAGPAEADDQNARLAPRVDELAAILPACVRTPPAPPPRALAGRRRTRPVSGPLNIDPSAPLLARMQPGLAVAPSRMKRACHERKTNEVHTRRFRV